MQVDSSLDQKIEQTKLNLEKAREKYAEYQTLCSELYEDLKTLEAQKYKQFDLNFASKEKFKYIFKKSYSHQWAYLKIKEYFNNLYKDVELDCSVNALDKPSDIVYPSLRITLNHNQDVDHLIAPILSHVDFIKYVYEIEAILLDIFEYTLSESGVYYGYVFSKDKAEIHKITYGHEKTIFSGTLEQVLKQISAMYYYK